MDFKDIEKLLESCITNYCCSVVDDCVKGNAEFHAQAGIKAKITRRTTSSKPCDWCKSLAGTYEYPVEREVYQRHRDCSCIVEYDPGDGKTQNAHTKEWRDKTEAKKRAERKSAGLEQPLKKNPQEKINSLQRKLAVRKKAVAKSSGTDIISVEGTQNFAEIKLHMKQNYDINVDDSVGSLDFRSVREGLQGVEYVMNEFPQASPSFKSIGTRKEGLMCAGYDGDICFNPGYYQTRETALQCHGIGEGAAQSNLHPKGNNCASSGAHEAGHILEKALIDKSNGGESPIGKLNWNECTYSKAVVSDACKAAKKLPECKGMRNFDLKNAISEYALKGGDSECIAEAVCDYFLNGDEAQPLSKEIWKILKKELG